LNKADVVRHPLVARIIEAYEQDEQRRARPRNQQQAASQNEV